MVNKSYVRTPKPSEQIKIEPSVAMIKGLLVDNIDGNVIYFSSEAYRIAKPEGKDKHRPVGETRGESVSTYPHRPKAEALEQHG